MPSTILRVALPIPVPGLYDYLPPADTPTNFAWSPGIRLRVPFGNRDRIAILVEISDQSTIDKDKLKQAQTLLETRPVIEEELMILLRWASQYYHYPLGECLFTALPTALRSGHSSQPAPTTAWRLNEQGKACGDELRRRAPRQQALIDILRSQPEGVGQEILDQRLPAWRPALRALRQRGWVEKVVVPGSRHIEHCPDRPAAVVSDRELYPEQQQAVDKLRKTLGTFTTSLLYGVTGSGKTEVYFQVITAVLERRQQALVLVPEIGLTPQLLDRFRRYFGFDPVVIHSAMTAQQRLRAWRQARDGTAAIILGTRSAIFTPLKMAGVIILDEEHDPSYKQQEGMRYHARDLALIRARHLDIPVILGSATPSLETLNNSQLGRYQRLHLRQRAGNATLPSVRLLDMRKQPVRQGLSAMAISAIGEQLSAGRQVLVFLNRRGYATTLICPSCGWLANCRRCDSRLILHRQEGMLRCHHCGHRCPQTEHCPDCQTPRLRQLGQGTERLETLLGEHFPDTEIIRIDRDTTRRAGQLPGLLARIDSQRPQILIGTQLLAKGHHFPGVTLVVIVDADYGLHGSDFRAGERMGQMILQVAGRAGRAKHPGQVILQTYHPEHPFFAPLLQHDYDRFANNLLSERQQAGFPPFCHQVLLRAEAAREGIAMPALADIADFIRTTDNPQIELLGPVPAIMEKRAGRYRAQLLLQTTERRYLHRLLNRLQPWLYQQKTLRKIRWSIDVDPIDLM